MLFKILGICIASFLLYTYIVTNILIHNKLKPLKAKKLKDKKVKPEKVKKQKDKSIRTNIRFSTIISAALIVISVVAIVLGLIFIEQSLYNAILITVAVTVIISVIKYITFKIDFPFLLEVLQNIIFLGFGIFLLVNLWGQFAPLGLLVIVFIAIAGLSWASTLITAAFTHNLYDDEIIGIPAIVTILAILAIIVCLFIYWNAIVMGIIVASLIFIVIGIASLIN